MTCDENKCVENKVVKKKQTVKLFIFDDTLKCYRFKTNALLVVYSTKAKCSFSCLQYSISIYRE